MRVDAVRQVDEDAAFGPHGFVGGEQRAHAVEQRQGQRDAESTQEMTTAEEPVLGEDICHDAFPFP